MTCTFASSPSLFSSLPKKRGLMWGLVSGWHRGNRSRPWLRDIGYIISGCPEVSLHFFGEHPTVFVNWRWKLDLSLNPAISPMRLMDVSFMSRSICLASLILRSVLQLRKSCPTFSVKYNWSISRVVPSSWATSSRLLSYSAYFFSFTHFFRAFSMAANSPESSSVPPHSWSCPCPAAPFLAFASCLLFFLVFCRSAMALCPNASSSSLWLPRKEMKLLAKYIMYSM